ncbi:hypothetical protein DFH08DRAFT_805557 [Mycena albidolilacea]|uniref:Uncharacterized protein n=1 Tax=Mycena albidolilacea TaxID=1033008 RepID=A0AAD7A8Q8_9AGAR|nr:hypothetical protein DFH08DRAFT_805557 [Mycena albidolilacea]
MDFFGGSSSFNTNSLFGLPAQGSFNFGSSGSQWSAVSEAKQELQPRDLSGPSRCDSFASTFTSMTDDELGNEVEPWAMGADSRFDFGFSSALRDSCVYSVPREYLPSDDDSDAGDESDMDTVIDTETETEEGVNQDQDVSDTETAYAAGDPAPQPTSAVEEQHDPEPLPSAPARSEFLDPPQCLPDTWLPRTHVHLTGDFPRRSPRVLRSSRTKLVELEASQTPTKRRQPAPKRPVSKKVAFVDKEDEPSSQPPRKAVHPATSAKQKGKGMKQRVILRV